MALGHLKIRTGNKKDLEQILNKRWAWNGQKKIQINYIKGIKEGRQEFLVIERGGRILGEIHIHWKNKDQNQANCKNRAYISTWRIDPDYRRQGLGRKLFQAAIDKIKGKGFTEATIGAYKHEPNIQKLYRRYGFTKKIKEKIDKTAAKNQSKYFLYLNKL